MRTPSILAVVLLCGIGAVAAKEDVRVSWLKENAIPLASIDPAAEDFKDLQPLKQLWKNVRIVQLGEQSHGDGACFLAKTRLIKFLHQELGFDVLAFESGLYDCDKGWRNIVADPKSDDIDQAGIFRIWTLSHEVKPLLAYLRAQAQSERPLELCGFDCQLTSQVSRNHLRDELAETAVAIDDGYLDSKAWGRVEQCLKTMLDHKTHFTAETRKAGVQGLSELATLLQSETAVQNLPPRRHAYYLQLLKSLTVQVDVQFKNSKRPHDINRRDGQMAKNMIWLADEHFKGRKIIVWAATSHIRSGSDKIRPLYNDDGSFGHFIPMGTAVRKHFGDQSYVLGFTALSGQRGLPWTEHFDLVEPPPGSLELVCAEAGLENALIDFRSAQGDGAWLQGELITRPCGYSPMRGPWAEVIDGMFYQRVMTPSTRSGYTPPPPVEDMRQGLEKQWASIQSGMRSGNMWANKWTFDDTFNGWKRTTKPSGADIKKQEGVVRKFLQDNKDEDHLVWRLHYLLATMATERQAPADAAKAYDAALKAFPAHDLPQPTKTSMFQHIVNHRALQILETKGAKKAVKWATDLLAKDRRFRYFWTGPWAEKDPGTAKDLRKALRKAYKKRKKKFKDLEDEIDGFIAQLG